tara:strand:+ start:41 stop:289 length:249 start_codon:yes stop_codon:yes gene_type:complete
MPKFGKNIFGKDFSLKAEVTNGKCPLCETPTVFVSLHSNFYRCMSCGGDTEQKINGIISYIPANMGETKSSVLPPDSLKENG